MREPHSLRIVVAGQKHFGQKVAETLHALAGIEIAAVAAPADDRLADFAESRRIHVITALRAHNMPDEIDLIIAAHSHDFIGERTRLRARFGGVGYHPSLLPLHRGRDAVRWAIRMRERVTGGTVYRLSNRMDGGEILAQRHVFIRPDDDAQSLWRRDLAPLGIEMLASVVLRFAEFGYQTGAPQDEELATWEPSIDRPPAFRPDLMLLTDQRATGTKK
ncbi:putative formyltransferase [uncultured Caudovirales phage]|uniref:Putative formyltransferase n=1 Tax=uncultured Caudovirales phage TaxID=2100421 RepID=A0A6J5L8R6_9CAUD|nr:putative formyltransferase [uncultured Caudovirales phage]